jgi:hypothetical protein
METNMSDYLTQFQAKTRRKADAELIRRWEWDARCNGEKNIKIQIANAKRTATSLQKAHQQFSNLRPEHELAMNAAASAMRALAAELEPLAAWAKDYKAFCDVEYKKRRTAELEAIATQRWGADEAKFKFEYELIQELSSELGRMALGQWMHSRAIYPDTTQDCFFSPFSAGFSGASNQRILAAEKIEEARRISDRTLSRNEKYAHCSWLDYEAYLAYRRDMAKTMALIVKMAS